MNMRDSYYDRNPECSLNAAAQALKVIMPKIKRAEFFQILGIPEYKTSVMRYYQCTYNITPWADRSRAEQLSALDFAKSHISTCAS